MDQPVFDCRDPTEIVFDMLLANLSHGNDSLCGVLDCRSEQRLAEKDSLAVMAERAMAHVGEVRFRFVEPVVDRQVVVGHSAEEPRRPIRVVPGMHYFGSLSG